MVLVETQRALRCAQHRHPVQLPTGCILLEFEGALRTLSGFPGPERVHPGPHRALQSPDCLPTQGTSVPGVLPPSAAGPSLSTAEVAHGTCLTWCPR